MHFPCEGMIWLLELVGRVMNQPDEGWIVVIVPVDGTSRVWLKYRVFGVTIATVYA